MSKEVKVAQGRFVWNDLMTSDAAAAKEFYGKLFGWNFSVWEPGEPYLIFGMGETRIGGIMPLDPNLGLSPHWICFVHVDDVDAVVARVEGLGGKIGVTGTDIPKIGRFAVISDPGGAFISPISFAADAEGATESPEGPGNFCWYELNTRDAEAAGAFYQDIFGWSRTETTMGEGGKYHIFKVEGTETAGMMNIPEGMEYPPYWLPYVEVEDADASMEKARQLGAKALVEPRDIPDIGRFAVFADPAGAVIAIFQKKHG